MLVASMIVAVVSGVVLIISVMMQDSKNAGFSAAMGGSDTAQFTKGSREELFDKITKVSAVIWIISCVLVALYYYR
jgi:protein translocase SecG subunit